MKCDYEPCYKLGEEVVTIKGGRKLLLCLEHWFDVKVAQKKVNR